MYPLPALLTPLPLIPLTTEEIVDCTIEAAKGAKKAPRNRPSCFLTSCFTASVSPSIITPKSSNDFMILIMSFIFSFKVNKVNPFPALRGPFPLIFLLILFTPFESKFLTNPGKLSLTKGIAIFVSVFFPKLANQ